MRPTTIRPYLEVRYAQGPSFSASGRRLAFLYDGPGSPQVYMIELHDGDDPDVAASWDRWPHQLTFHGDRCTFCRFLPGSESLIVYGRDHGGDEKEELRLLDVDSGREDVISEARGALHVLGAISRDGTLLAYATNERSPTDFDLVVFDLETRESRTVWEHPGWNRAVGFSPDGARLYAVHHTSNLANVLYEVPLGGDEPRPLLGVEDAPSLTKDLAVHPETGELFVCEDLGHDRLRLSRRDPESTEGVLVAEPGWDVEAATLGADGGGLAYAVNREGISQVFVRDLARGHTRRVEGLPVGVVSGMAFSPDGGRLAMTLSGDRHPTNVWIAPRGGRPFEATQAPRGHLAREALLSSRLARFRSFDGLEVPTWVVGEGEQAVIVIHGGPEGQSRPRFNPVVQYLAAHGYTVVLPNVRGSSGYGRRYLGLDDVERRMDSVRDIAALHDWMGETGLCDPDRVAVMGGSYGGFMVLACVTEFPERWRCGVDFVGIANFRTFLENTGAYRRKIREAEYGSLEAHGALLDSISPIHKVDRIRCPMLLAHGRNDPRVPLEEAEQVARALADREVPHRLLVFDDEGHGIAKRRNRITLYEEVADFLSEHL